MNKKRFFIMCTFVMLCTLTISTKVKASKYTDETQYIENTNVLAEQIKYNTVNRNNSFSILAKITSDKPVEVDKLNKYADSLVSKAMSENLADSSSAGDYLRYSWDEYKKSIKGFYNYENYSYKYYLVVNYEFKYYTTYNQEQKLNKDVETFIKRNIRKDDTDLEKITTIYKYISNTVKYKKNIGNIKYSAYSAYENKAAICQGYSALLYKMLKEAEVDDVRIVRSSTHSWNIVKIDNMYYHLDSTWEATSSKKGNYNYFLKGSDAFNRLNKHNVDSEYKTKKFKKEYPISDEDYMKVKITSLKKLHNNTIKIKWKGNIYCDGYKIEYSSNKNFNKYKSVIINSKYITSKTIKNLKNNKKYYIRISTYKKVNNKKYYFLSSKYKVL